jgi:hypothetical protein
MANIAVTDASRSTVPGWSLSIADFGSLIMADTSKLASPAQPNRANRSGAEEFTMVTISPIFTPD